jgi:DNA-binding MarR family transcriptional regulator
VPPTPPVTQIVGQTAGILRQLLKDVLADTGTTYNEWIALNLTAASAGIDRGELITELAQGVQVDDPIAEATVSGLTDAGSLETSPDSVVGLTDAGRDQHARLRGLLVKATEPLSADIPADDLATTQRVLHALAQRADAAIAQR